MKELNLVPKAIIENQKKGKKKSLINRIIAFIVVIFIGINLFYFIEFQRFKKQNSDLNITLEKYEEVLNEDEKISKETKEIINHIEKVNMLESEKNNIISKIIKDFQKEIPKDVVIENFNYSGKTISISASSKSYNSVLEFWANIENNHIYKGIELPAISENSDKSYRFNAVIEIVEEN
ncbi:PilN domain-containing protein [Clostridium senegalense]